MLNSKLIDIDDRQFRINTSTGEAEEQITITVPVGTKWRTPAQQKQSSKYFEELKQSVYKSQKAAEMQKELGGFFFILADKKLFSDLSPQNISRMIMLCSYLREDKFVKWGGKPLLKKDLMEILKLSKAAAYKFFGEVVNNYIIEKSDGLYIKPEAKIYRGKLPKSSTNFEQFQKIYIAAVRKIYNSTAVTKHRQLGYVFKLLPYINLQYNIICYNPFEMDLDLVEPLTLNELCDILPYDKTQVSRLLKEFNTLKFDYKGHKEYLLSYVTNNHPEFKSHRIFVNPHIIYNGLNYKRVEVLGVFCKDSLSG